MFFYLSLVAADKALAGLGQCRFILCIVAGFKLGRYLYLLGGCPQTQRLSRLAARSVFFEFVEEVDGVAATFAARAGACFHAEALITKIGRASCRERV